VGGGTGRNDAAITAVFADPGTARSAARPHLDAARRGGDVAAEVVAHRALGLAARELNDAAAAAVHLRRAVRLAERHGLAERAAEARMSLALTLDDLGRPAAAVREIDRAVASLRGLPRARARMQRAIILRRLGRDQDALDDYAAALVSLRRGGDRVWQARALTNRGVLLSFRGALRQAETDLRRAERIYADLGLATALAQVRHNLGYVAAQAGDVPAAMTWYDRAEEHFRANGRPVAALLDRAELMLDARLLPEARAAAEAAVAACVDTRLATLLPHARLLVAQAALAAGDRPAARAAADAAGRAFQRQGRARWAAVAAYLSLRAGLDVTRPTAARLARARAVADALRDADWTVPALEARIFAVELASRLPAGPAVAAAYAELAEVAEAPDVLRHGSARLRARAWYGRALGRLHVGDRSGATRALTAGLRVVDQYRAALGATELRVHSSAEGRHMSRLGLRLALADGRPRQVLAWAERWRAATLRLAPAQPSYSDQLTQDLAQLRRVTADLSTMDGDPQRQHRLRVRQRVLENAIRRRTWRAGGDRAGASVAGPAVGAALGDRALVELVEWDGRLSAVVLAGGRAWLRPLCTTEAAERESVALRFAFRRLATRHGSPGSLAAAAMSARHSADVIDNLVLAPVRDLIGDRSLVVVPTGALHGVPWPVLPTCRGRPVTVAPSAETWRRAAERRQHPDGPTVFVATDDPPHAIGEVSAIAADLAGASLLLGEAARVPEVTRAIDGAHLAHLATHGTYRADNPMFSHLFVADGALTVYDLAHVRRPPDLMILSACDAGLSTVYPGDELMGFTSALLGLGVRTLLAGVGPVDDGVTRELMIDVHRRLRAGGSPAVALAAAQSAYASADEAWATAHTFVCFGAG
jgi:tetratricopeptide (TPR) repeat protein